MTEARKEREIKKIVKEFEKTLRREAEAFESEGLNFVNGQRALGSVSLLHRKDHNAIYVSFAVSVKPTLPRFRNG